MNKLLLSSIGATTAGALTLISPDGWSTGVRRAYVVVPGVLAAAFSAVLLSEIVDRQAAVASRVESVTEVPTDDAYPLPQRHPVAVRVAGPVLIGAATCGLQAASLCIDAALERSITRLGAAHPRRWMAALAVAASLSTDAVGEHLNIRTARARTES
ncbi:hypothetical protein GMA12_11975 [Kocuria sediminis]|uniref:Uncharacterized protein n=1 Tax=Kocuria sediminis TaxID=1038857 RepID=A0A6N8GSE5_9MICC|nr:hypothetical protein [Kocuria sediminis]MUN63845.1 hypothetical protein [Kocuria sediminis]